MKGGRKGVEDTSIAVFQTYTGPAADNRHAMSNTRHNAYTAISI